MPPNNAFEPTPQCVEQDGTDFESRIRLERFPDLNEQLLALPGLSPLEQSAAIQWICGQLSARLLRDNIVPGDMANPDNLPWFFRFREEILRAITDPEIRNLAW